MATKTSIVQDKAFEFLDAEPNGIRYADLVRKIREVLPGYPEGTVTGSVWNIDTTRPEKVYKASRGLFKSINYKEDAPQEVLRQDEEKVVITTNGKKVKEDDFYESFAIWLEKDMEECSKAIALGKNYFKDKWGTPDVIGILEPKKSDIVKYSLEITSVEMKIDSTQSIIAFGQACSYRLFSHKVYIVIPRKTLAEDLDRLDSLCLLMGIGLILFDADNPDEPNYEIRNRPNKSEPDYFYVNRNLKLIESELFA